MKVLLISANAHRYPYPVYPLGLDYVAGALRDKHTVLMSDVNLPGAMETIPALLEGENPQVVGISIRNIDNTDTSDPQGFMGSYTRLVAMVRRHCRAPVVLGGAGFSIFPREIMTLLDADFGIAGEGEGMALLLDVLYSGDARGPARDFSHVPGLFVRDRRVGAPLSHDGNSLLPTPFQRAFSKDYPHLDYYLRRGGMLNLQTKRGCPFHCVYRTYPHIEGRTMRLFDPFEVARTAVALQDGGARYLFVTDSAFNSDVGHSLAVARAFEKAGLSIPWGAYFTPAPMPEGYFGAMKQAGLSHVEFGTESLSGRVLKAYGKPFDPAQAMDCHRDAVAQGLHVAHFMLLGGPGETGQTLDTTLERLERLEKTVVFFYPGMRIYPHTPLFHLAVREGQIPEAASLLEPVFYRSPSIDTAHILDRVQARAGGYPNWIIGTGGETTARRLSTLYRRGFSGPLWEFLIR
ncbi:MAG: cobalamin-dependent protein [Pseudomonadota bacterium]